jgi:diguanylate cyclase (GGDEF)-like protein/PAS domain S-box-containing protein
MTPQHRDPASVLPLPALRGDAAFLGAVLEEGSDLVLVVDGNARLRYANHAAEAALGRTREELAGRDVFDLVHPDDVDRAVESLGGTTTTGPGRKVPVELRGLHADGSWRRLEVIATNLLDDPSVGGIVLAARDITELRAAEDDLRRAEEEFRALVAHSSDIITVLEPDGSWRSSSAAGTRLLGYPEGLEVEGGIFSLLHPDDVDLAARTFTEVVEGRRADDAPVVFRVRSADGSRCFHLETVARNLVDHPAVRGIVLNSRDVTERVVAEDALRATQGRFQSLVQHASDLITVVDADSVIRYVSPSVTRMLGFDPEELIGTSGSDLVHPDDLPDFIGAIMDQLTPGAEEHAVQYRAKHRHGGWRLLEGVTTNLLDDPTIQGFVTNARDITRRVEAEAALHRSDERFRALVQNATDVVTIVDPDARISYASPSIEQTLGYSPDELVGSDPTLLIHPDDHVHVFEASTESVQTGQAVPVEYRAVAKDGSIRHFEGITSDLTDEPSVAGFVTNARDISDRHEAEREAARLTEVLDHSNEVVVISAPDGALVYANQRAKEFLGLGDQHDVGELTSVESRERLRDEVMPHVRSQGLWNGELTFRTTMGNEIPMIATVQAHREDGAIVLISTIAHDITALKLEANRLEYEANHDKLTGLPNRAMLQELGEQALARASRQGALTGVLFLDLDGFKEINDTLGHDAGDRVLVELGRSLRVGVRSGDLVVRLGGDEFCVLCESVENAQELLDLGQRICDIVSIPMRVHGREVQVGTSIGIAMDRGGGETIGGLVRNADVALYRAKHAGGRCVEIFDPLAEASSHDGATLVDPVER